MKPVAAHALRVEALRDRIMVRQRRMHAVEGGVETCDLKKPRRADADRPDRREIVGLMQRRQRRVAFEMREHRVVDHHRLVVLRPAADDPMPPPRSVRAAASRAAIVPALCSAAGTVFTCAGS